MEAQNWTCISANFTPTDCKFNLALGSVLNFVIGDLKLHGGVLTSEGRVSVALLKNEFSEPY
jgi:hypothetical protein